MAAASSAARRLPGVIARADGVGSTAFFPLLPALALALAMVDAGGKGDALQVGGTKEGLGLGAVVMAQHAFDTDDSADLSGGFGGVRYSSPTSALTMQGITMVELEPKRR